MKSPEIAFVMASFTDFRNEHTTGSYPRHPRWGAIIKSSPAYSDQTNRPFGDDQLTAEQRRLRYCEADDLASQEKKEPAASCPRFQFSNDIFGTGLTPGGSADSPPPNCGPESNLGQGTANS